jgi:superfamily II DNA or RNA helicase
MAATKSPRSAAADFDLDDLEGVEQATGRQAFSRGRVLARGKRVMSVSWDRGSGLLSGRVLGNGGLYDTAAYFSWCEEHEQLEFEQGECTCPVGWDCKHVAALTIFAAASAGSAPGTMRSDRPPAPSGEAQRGGRRGSAQHGGGSQAWEAPLRAMLPSAAAPAAGTPLALELSIASQKGLPRLHARLMRPGARGGWINGSLSWGSLEPWSLRGQALREDHLDLARAFRATEMARTALSSRYVYGYGSRERTLDLTDWEAGQLWDLIERANRIGMPILNAGREACPLPPPRTGELLLDVRAAEHGGATVKPTVRFASPIGAQRLEPLMFLGETGHGIVLRIRPADVDALAAGSPGSICLVRLARPAPPALRRMVLEDSTLAIPQGDLDRFATELAPGLRSVAPVCCSDASIEIPEVSEPELTLRAEHGIGHLASVSWGWSYAVGDRRLEFELAPSGGDAAVRDLEAERSILDTLGLDRIASIQSLPLLDPFGRPSANPTLLDGFQTARFVTEVLPALAELPALRIEVGGEVPQYRDASDSLQIGLATSEIAGERDWFDLAVTITVEGREVPFASVFAALARGESRLLLEDGAHFSLESAELRSLRELIEEARSLGEGSSPGTVRISHYQAGLWQELLALGVVREQAERWRARVDRLLKLDSLEEHPPPAELRAELRPYQLEGFSWLASLWDLGLGGILADDMGLGKTVQALALICHALGRRGADPAKPSGLPGPPAGEPAEPFLVIAPTSVVPGWLAEAQRFAPSLRVRAMTDTLARARASIEEVTRDADVVLSTYALARLDAAHYQAVRWAGVILDEAQAVKNPNAKTHVAIRRLQAPFKLAITGTPMENNLGELWALLSITAPGLFPDPNAFAEQYAKPIERLGDHARLERLRRRIRPLVKRRTKELVAAELPPKQEQLLEVDLHPRHRRLYELRMQRERQRILGLLDDMDANRFTILAGITRLRQLSLHAGLFDEQHRGVPCAKIDALLEQLQDVIGGGHRALVFSQFTGFLALVRERLEAERIPHCYLDGTTTRRDRVLTDFKRGAAPVFLISLKAGGFGLNLAEADYCFLLDPWWNPAVEAQAIDRAHRIGQNRTVMVYRLIARRTIEEKVVALAQRKAALFRGVLDAGDLFAGEITAQDIRGLLG